MNLNFNLINKLLYMDGKLWSHPQKNNLINIHKQERQIRNTQINKKSQTLIDLKDIITKLNLNINPFYKRVESKTSREKYQFHEHNIKNYSNLINSEKYILGKNISIKNSNKNVGVKRNKSNSNKHKNSPISSKHTIKHDNNRTMSGVLISQLKKEKKNSENSHKTYHKYFSGYLYHFLSSHTKLKKSENKKQLRDKNKTNDIVLFPKEKIQKVNTLIKHFHNLSSETNMKTANNLEQKDESKLNTKNKEVACRRSSLQYLKNSKIKSRLRFIDLINQTFTATSNKQYKISMKISQYSFYSKAGLIPNTNKVNQDNIIICSKINDNENNYLFGVADGHGEFGHEVSNIIKTKFPEYISKNLLKMNPQDALVKTFEDVNIEIYKNVSNVQLSGSTCSVVLIMDQQIYCANTGDSRAIICSYENLKIFASPLSRDHKPTEIEEAERIINLGGRIEPFKDENNEFVGPLRIWMQDQDVPGLAMTRSLGDAFGSHAGVSAVPEIMVHLLSQWDQFIIIGSDGIWEFLSNDDCCKIIMPFFLDNNSESASRTLVNEAHKMWEDLEDIIDDITCVIIFLKQKSSL